MVTSRWTVWREPNCCFVSNWSLQDSVARQLLRPGRDAGGLSRCDHPCRPSRRGRPGHHQPPCVLRHPNRLTAATRIEVGAHLHTHPDHCISPQRWDRGAAELCGSRPRGAGRGWRSPGTRREPRRARRDHAADREGFLCQFLRSSRERFRSHSRLPAVHAGGPPPSAAGQHSSQC